VSMMNESQLSIFNAGSGSMRIETTISSNYLPHWNVLSAIKEFVQNAVFAKTILNARIKLSHDGRIAHISDNGQGFSKDKLLVGEGEQRGCEYAPGEIGEGMKMALLVAARNNLECRIETVGYTVEAKIEKGILGGEVMVMYLHDNKKTQGTEFIIECDEYMFKQALESFAVFNDIPIDSIKESCILPKHPNRVYVSGVLISEPVSLWGYNITDKSLINRDRSTVDHEALVDHIKKLLTHIKKPALAEVLISAIVISKRDLIIECQACPSSDPDHYTDEQVKMWQTAFRKVVGKKVCLSGYGDDDTLARYSGFQVLSNINSSWRDFLNCILEVPYSYAIAQKAAKKKYKRKPVKLVSEEKSMLTKYQEVILSFYADCKKIKVAEDLHDDYENKCNGLHDPNNDMIWLDRSILSSEEELFKTLLHETIHKKTGARDNCTSFTNGWEDACWKLYSSISRSVS